MNTPASASAPEGATKQERTDFLKQVVTFTEGNIRSYDAKAQISLAAFVLSANPLVAVASAACSQAGGRAVLMVLVPAYIAAILTYLWVLWPVAPPARNLTEGLKIQDIFFIRDAVGLGSVAYVDRLGKLSLEPEFTAEALKLSHIRGVKAGRFKVALIATVLAYLFVAASYFFVGRCF